jgi:hypothetical protein
MDIPGMIGRLLQTWETAPAVRSEIGRSFSPKERVLRERALARFTESLRAESKRPEVSKDDLEAARTRIFGSFELFAREGLDWQDRHINALFGGGFDRSGNEFMTAAREFDARLTAADIFQACRNVWVANGLQALLGRDVRLTPSVFAYSLLYPYTDNYLDDPAASEEAKRSFSSRLHRRLAGADEEPTDPREKTIFGLVGMIEGEFDRARYPQVFESLLAIHDAQERSVRLLRSGEPVPETEALAIALEKGGASVLADGCLVAGALVPAQVEFLFGFGAFLQLMDDLEDVEEDIRAGVMTIFARRAKRGNLDPVTAGLLAFGVKVLEGLAPFAAGNAEPLQELIRSSLIQGVVSTAGRAGKRHSRRYLREIESYSPFRFSFAERERRKLTRRKAALMRLFEAFSAVSR